MLFRLHFPIFPPSPFPLTSPHGCGARARSGGAAPPRGLAPPRSSRDAGRRGPRRLGWLPGLTVATSGCARPPQDNKAARLRVEHAVQAALGACRPAAGPAGAAAPAGWRASQRDRAEAALRAGAVARAFVVGASTGAVGAALLAGFRARGAVPAEGVEPGPELDGLLARLAALDAVFVADPAAPLGEAQLERLHQSPARVQVLRAIVPGDLLRTRKMVYAVPEAVRPEVEDFLQTRQPSMIRDLATAAPARAPAQAGEVRDLASYKRWCAAAPPEPRQLERGLTAD